MFPLKNNSKKEVVVYTALFGNYDELEGPTVVDERCDYVCFTDQKIKSDIWEIIKITPHRENNLMNREFKILPHKYFSNYKYSLYIDANLIIKIKPSYLIERHLVNNFMAVPKHVVRNCAYLEAFRSITSNRINAKKVFLQMTKYANDGFPIFYGLTENSILLRKHNNKELISLMNFWWDEIRKNAHRDQLCFQYSLWKKKQKISIMDENCRPPYKSFGFKTHKVKKKNFFIFKALRLLFYIIPLAIIIYSLQTKNFIFRHKI